MRTRYLTALTLCGSFLLASACSAPLRNDGGAAGDAMIDPANGLDGDTALDAAVTLPDGAMVPPGGDRMAVWTSYYDNQRTGANLRETTLTTASVTSGRFGLLFSRAVQGQIYAQPLYVAGVDVPGHGRRNLVVVATEHNMVYAFDADDPAAAMPYWSVDLGPTVPVADVGDPAPCPDLAPEIGITATPVIDLATNTVYVEAKSKEMGSYFHRLHALDLATGTERAGSPVEITASIPGTGEGSDNGMLGFDPLREHARPGLLLDHGVVYMAFASHCDREPYHGWVLAYDAATLHQRAAYATTRNGQEGGIWMSGAGMSADAMGDVYFVSGNGSFDPMASPPELSNAFVRLRLAGNELSVVDWFVPYNQQALNDRDFDLGSTTVLHIPGTNLILGGSKEGQFYVIDRDHMGRYVEGGNDSQIVQRFQATRDMDYSHIHGSPVYWSGPMGPLVYVMGEEDSLRAFRMMAGRMDTTPAMMSTVHAADGMPGGMLAVSANGAAAGSGIVWVNMPLEGDANRGIVPGIVRAFDASDLTHELWNSEQAAGGADRVGLYAKFVPPTVANGRVYLATFSDRLNVYGLR